MMDQRNKFKKSGHFIYGSLLVVSAPEIQQRKCKECEHENKYKSFILLKSEWKCGTAKCDPAKSKG
jgi:hypothetical protein